MMHAEKEWSDINGYAIGSGLRLKKLDLPDFLDFLWWFMVKDADHEGKEKVRIWLWRPPKGVEAKQGPWSVEAETSSFKVLKQQLTAE